MNEIQIINDEGYVSEKYLIKNGVNKNTLRNYFSKAKNKQSYNYQYFTDKNTNTKWVLYRSIPEKMLEKIKLPKRFEVLKYSLGLTSNIKKNKKLREIFFILENAWINPLSWKKFMIEYSDYIIEREKKILFAKTHSIIDEVIQLKKSYFLKDIHSMYMKIEKALFWTSNYSYFSQKIVKAEKEGISETIVHDFMRLGRNNYKVSQLVKNRIIFYYSNPKRYSYKKITEKVNEELLVRGKKTISVNSVKKLIKNENFKNRADLLRYGEEYSTAKILPYMRRAEPNHIAELYQVDTAKINLPYKKDNGEIGYLHLCVMMDVFSRKIIGHSIAETENFIMIIECIKSAFESFGYIPKQIVHDNHVSYHSEEFRHLKHKLDEYGVHIRAAKRKNPKDKAQIERWFRTFNTHYLSSIVGYLGDGIKTKIVGGRAQKELEELYKKKTLLKSKKNISQLIQILIKEYNGKQAKKIINNEEYLKFEMNDIAKLFFKVKNKKVNRSMIHMQVKKQNFTYTIKNYDLANEINGKIIKVRYDEMHPERIYLFKGKNQRYLGFLKSDKLLSIVPTEEEIIKISKHNSMIKKYVRKSFEDLTEEIDNGKSELTKIPLKQVFNNEVHLNKIIEQSEDELLISEMINKYNSKNKVTDKENIKTKYISNRYYNKYKRKRIKVVEDNVKDL